MTSNQETGRRFRQILLIAGCVYVLAGLAWVLYPAFDIGPLGKEEFAPVGLIGTPLGLGLEHQESGTYAINALVVVGLILLAQWFFLRPRGAWVARLTTQGRPLRSSVLIASAMAMLLSLGAIALILELPDVWSDWMDEKEFLNAAPWMFGGMLIMWAFWFVIFAAYWRQGDRFTQLGRIIRGLVAGSLVEAFVAIPVHIWMSRQRECYCARGSYTTLVCAGTVLFWAFGPGILLLYAREKYRMAKLYPRCTKCDYDLRGSVSGVCPECGTIITQRKSSGDHADDAKSQI